MISNLGTLEIQCDAPAYEIVRTCQWLNFQSPLDVRWSHLDHLTGRHGDRPNILRRIWRIVFGPFEGTQKLCPCGLPLPNLERYLFPVLFPKESDCLLGQCPRCQTIYWQEVQRFVGPANEWKHLGN
jgi:hypothetical protein